MPINGTALLVSRDSALLATREMILRQAGCKTHCETNLQTALNEAYEIRPDLVIIGHTFNAQEREDFIDALCETNPNVHVLALRFGLVQPEQLLAHCERLMSGQPGGLRVRLVQEETGSVAAIRSSLEIA